MKTKVILTTNGIENELASDCLYNWDEVRCAYKRTDFSGVVRSFSSEFEFVNDAYELLLSAFIKDGVRAVASVAIYVLNNDWSWSKEFEAALNFSTATWDGYIFSINCLDDGLASLIKSNKSVKYEFGIGKDIEAWNKLKYDRLTLLNSCSHEIMGDSNASDGAVLISNAPSLTRLPVYSIKSESFENSPILYQDQTTETGSAFITTVRDVPNLKMRLEIWADSPGSDLCYAEDVEIHLMKFADNDINITDMGVVFTYSADKILLGPGSGAWGIDDRVCVGTFKSFGDLQRAYPNPPQDVWAMIASGPALEDVESVYFTPISNKSDMVQWELGKCVKNNVRRNGSIVRVSCESKKYITEFDLSNLGSDQKFALFYKAKIVNVTAQDPNIPYFPIFSKITTYWESKAKAIEFTAIKPASLLKRLVEKMSDEKYNIIPQFSDSDSRLEKTYLLAAESIRGIEGAKIYSSFNDFCDWMETVFGYVYTLGDPVPAQYKGIRKIWGIEDNWSIDIDGLHGEVVEGYCPDGYYGDAPVFISSHNCFCVFDNHETGNMYTLWKDSPEYNDENGKARKDLIFDDGQEYYVIGANNEIIPFAGDIKAATRITQTIQFLHRGELFRDQIQDVVFTNAVELQSKVDNSILYSIVEIGYAKQDYGTECGRDEWNFMNYYNTDIDVVEKKLTLQSKYRADCYGLEFLAQERAKDSTDNKSDNTIFFVYCKLSKREEEQLSEEAGTRGDEDDVPVQETYNLEIDRTSKIDGALTDTVFNGEFSPYYCIKANEGYISAMAPNVKLRFASSDGNSDIVIDGVKTSADITLTQRLFSEVELQFTAAEFDETLDFSKLIKVIKNGLSYTGFVKQTECCYARPTEVEYTLIVKSIEQL